MPLDDLSLVFICRACEHMLRAKEHGQDQCDQKCGGPSKGMTFPCYKGQVPLTYLVKYCYKCGKDASATLGLRGHCFGLCETHTEGLTP